MNNSTTGNKTINFPISFSSECYVVCTGPYSQDTGNVSAQQITKTSFYMTAPSTADCEYARYLAAGK